MRPFWVWFPHQIKGTNSCFRVQRFMMVMMQGYEYMWMRMCSKFRMASIKLKEIAVVSHLKVSSPRCPLFYHFLIFSKDDSKFVGISLCLIRSLSKHFDGDINLVHVFEGGIKYCKINLYFPSRLQDLKYRIYLLTTTTAHS